MLIFGLNSIMGDANKHISRDAYKQKQARLTFCAGSFKMQTGLGNIFPLFFGFAYALMDHLKFI